MNFSRASLCLFVVLVSGLAQAAAAGRLFDRHREYRAGVRPTWLAPGDFDEDGVPDFAVGDPYEDRVWLLRGVADGSFVGGQMIVPDMSQAYVELTGGVVSGDFNADGHADIALALQQPFLYKQGPDLVQVFYGTGRMTFALGDTLAVGDYPTAMLADDLDGNGTLDLAVFDYETTDVALLRGLGADGFLPAEFLEVTRPGYNIRSGDLDGDGRKDLVVSHVDPFLSILTGNADGTFAPAQQVPLSVPTAHGLLVADLDVDGRDDLAVSHVDTDQILVLLNRTDPAGLLRFADPVSYGTKSPTDLLAADLDRDGILDVGVGAIGSDAVAILPGRGNGLFGRAGTYKVGNGPQDIEAADLNGDGLLDLVTAGFGSGSISVLLGR